MKKLKKSELLHVAGEVFTTSRQGRLIVKLEGYVPRLGQRVYDKTLKCLGIVVDVIGNVRSPYAVVKPLWAGELKGAKGMHLYFKD